MNFTDQTGIECDALSIRVAELEIEIQAAAAVERSLKTQLSLTNEELIKSLNDLVALGNLLRNEEQKSSKLAEEIKAKVKERQDLHVDKVNADKKLIALRVKHEAVLNDLAARNKLLFTQEQKCSSLAEFGRDAKKRIQEQEHTLAVANAEIGALRYKLEVKVKEQQDLHAEKAIGEKKLAALRVRHEIVNSESMKYERELNSMAKVLELNRFHAATSSKILKEMAKRRLVLPMYSAKPGFFDTFYWSHAKRWQRFCRTLAEDGVFDSESYLSLHSDVATAGVNPVVHFLTLGVSERRAVKMGSDQ